MTLTANIRQDVFASRNWQVKLLPIITNEFRVVFCESEDTTRKLAEWKVIVGKVPVNVWSLMDHSAIPTES